MRVKVPKTIKIGTHTYTIKFNHHLRSDDNKYAEVNHRTQAIDIWADAAVSLKNESLLHELIHIGEFIYRVEINDADVDRLAETVAEFLFNNLDIELDWSDVENIK